MIVPSMLRNAMAAIVIACGSAFDPSAAIATTECRVIDLGGDDPVPGLQGARAQGVVRSIVNRTAGNAVAGAATPAQTAATPPRDEPEAVRRAIGNRDLPAFIAALPAEPAQRQAVLRKSLALESAFTDAALPIVRQILRWQPDALAELSAQAKQVALERVASEWSTLQYFAEHGVPVANPPAEEDFPALIELLIKAGAAPDGQLDWRPPLGIVASLPRTPATVTAARLLLAAGADVNAPRPGAQPPLVFAAQSANAEILRLMLETHHASHESLDAAIVKTPLVAANEALPLLLAAGADINTLRPPGGDPRVLLTPAETAATRFKFAGERDLVRLMIRYHVDPNRQVRSGVTDSPLMLVTPDVELMRGFLELGADPNYRNVAGDTALLLALRAPDAGRRSGDAGNAGTGAAAESPSDRLGAVALLLDHGADGSLENKAGESPLKATRADDAPIVALLMAHGASWKLGARDLSAYTERQIAVGRYGWAVLQHKDALALAMLTHGEPISRDDCGLVYYAAASGSNATLGAILGTAGVDPHVRDMAGLTPLMAAVTHDHIASVRLLLDRGAATVDERTPRGAGLEAGQEQRGPERLGGETALMLAARMNRVEIAEELIRRGADVNAHDFAGRSVIAYGLAGYGRDIVPLLQSHGARD